MKIRDRIKTFKRVRAGDLMPNPKNWRVHPENQQNALRGSLAEVGWADAVLARETKDGLMLIDGHLRAEVAPDEKVPVLVLDVDDAEADKILATHDPLAAMATADAAQLESLLGELEFENEDLQKMLDELSKEAGVEQSNGELQDPEPQLDRAEELLAAWDVKPGQLWEIKGKQTHRLLCGDSTKAEDVGRVMGGEKAGLCFTSPPYAQQRDYGKKIDDWDGLMQGVFGNLPMTNDGQVLVNLGLIHRDGEWVPYWDGWIEWMRAQGWRRFGWYVWDQMRGLPGDWNGRFAPSHEFVFHFNRKPLRPTKHVECNTERAQREREQVRKGIIKTGLRDKDGSVCKLTSPELVGQSHKIPDSVLRCERHMANDVARRNHPATFSVDLAIFVLKSWRGITFDPFLGSGTTMVAAEQLDRRCFSIEVEPKYVAVALERMAALDCKCSLVESRPKKGAG